MELALYMLGNRALSKGSVKNQDLLVQILHDWQEKGGGLASASHCASEHVLSCQHCGDAQFLDLSWISEIGILERLSKWFADIWS